MRKTQLFPLYVAAMLLLTAALSAQTMSGDNLDKLAGKNVLLLVGPNETTAGWRASYLEYLRRTGVDPSKYDVYRTERLSEEITKRLGVQPSLQRYGALVRWGNPGRFGPARILSSGVVVDPREARDIFRFVESALDESGQHSRLSNLTPELQELRPRPRLKAVEHGFEANGRPLYLLDTRVRLQNSGNEAARNVKVTFSVKDPVSGDWFELGSHRNIIVPPGKQITRNLVRSTRDTPLLNDEQEILPAVYQIHVESEFDTIDIVDSFEPALLIDQPTR